MRYYTVGFGDTLDAVIHRLAKEKGVEVDQVLRCAVATYRYLLTETQEGFKVCVTDEELNIVKEVQLP